MRENLADLIEEGRVYSRMSMDAVREALSELVNLLIFHHQP